MKYFNGTYFADKRCKTFASEIQAAVDEVIFLKQAIKPRQCFAHINELEDHLKN